MKLEAKVFCKYHRNANWRTKKFVRLLVSAMPNEWKGDWKDYLATGISLLIAGTIVIFLILPFQFFQQHLLITGILFAIIYVIIFFLVSLLLKKEERIRLSSFFKKSKL